MLKKKWNSLSSLRKKAFTVTLATAVVSSTLNIGSYVVSADSSMEGRYITAFEELPDDVAYQFIPVGAPESDIYFPDELNVTLYSEEAEEEEPSEEREEEKEEEKKEEEKEEEPSGEESGEETPTEEVKEEEKPSEESEEKPSEEKSDEEEEKPSEENSGEKGEKPSEENSGEDGEKPSEENKEDTQNGDSGSDEGKNGEEVKEEDKIGSGEEIKEEPEEEVKEEEKEEQKEEVKEEVKEEPKEEVKEEVKEEPKEEVKEEVKEEPKEEEKEEAKEEQKEEEKEEPKEETGEEQGGSGEKTEEAPAAVDSTDTPSPAEDEGSGEEDNLSAMVQGIRNAFLPVDVYASENVRELSEGEKKTLKKVKWKLNREKSTYGSYFQAVFEDDVFVYEPDISKYGLKSDAPLPEIRVTIIEAEDETSSTGETDEEAAGEESGEASAETEEKTVSPEFRQLSVIGGVKVGVEADPGVFPEGAVLHVRKISGDAKERIDETLNSENTQSFDITVTDKDGNEIQPDTSVGRVRVTFNGIDVTGEDVRVIHFDNDLVSHEELNVTVNAAENSATVDASHFSVYTVLVVNSEAAEAAEPEILGKSVKDQLNDYVTAYTGEYDGKAHDSVSVNESCPEDIKNKLTFKSGSSPEFSKEIPQITDAGEYVVSVSVDSVGGVLRPVITPKELTETMVTVSDSYYLGTAVENAIVKDESNALVKDVDYKAQYTNNVNPGTAKVTITGMGNYKGTITREFKIIQYSGTYSLKYNGSTVIAEWYKDAVTVSADGFYISDNLNGPFNETYTMTGDARNVSKAVYLKNTASDNGIVGAVAGPLNFDVNPPKGTVKVKGKTFSGLQNEKKTFAYTNESQKVAITSEDTFNGSGVKSTSYFITNKFYSTRGDVKEAAEGEWEEYDDNSKPGLKDNKLNYVYVKIVDKVGHETYLSSQGVWYDTKKPSITSAKASDIKDTTADLTIKGSDGESGVKNYYMLYKKKSEKKPKAADVKSGGKKSDEDDGKYEITGLTASTAYVAYSVVEDYAGNLSDVKETKINTKAKDNSSDTTSSSSSAAGGAGSGSGAGGAGAGAGAAGAAGGAGGAGSAGGAGGAGGAAGSGGSSVSDKKALAEKAKADSNGEEEEESEDEGIPDKIPFIEDASEGITIGREKTSGWERIDRETKDANAPAQITVNMNGETRVPASVFNDIKDRDVAMRFRMNDDVSWTVNGLSFTGDAQNIDFRVRTNTKNIPSSLVNEIADVYPHMNLTLEHDGEFGFTAIMGLNVGKENRGMHANLYYYNEEENGLDFIASSDVDGKGLATFDFTHASDYTVIIRGDNLTEKSAAAIADRNTSGGDTGDTDTAAPTTVPKRSNRLWLILISIISILLCGVILFMPDKKRNAVS